MSQPKIGPGVKPKITGPYECGAGRHRYTVHGTDFEIPTKYKLTKALGYGAYGFVCGAVNTEDGQRYAIKKCKNVFNEIEDGKRILREIKLLTFLQHENLLSITELLPPRDKYSWEDVYIVGDLMDTDMNNVLRSRQKLTEDHYQYFMYQLLRGLKYLHSAEVLHRDLKPANLLTNVTCELRICDFGLSRELHGAGMTDYVVTRWYRAPELLLMCTHYTPAIDIWSCGCIFAEMMNRRPLFNGRDYLDQLRLITEVIGTPQESDYTAWLTNKDALRWLRDMPKKAPRNLVEAVPKLSSRTAVDFLQRMLTFDPAKRWTAEQLLGHPYLSSLHDPSDEPTAPRKFHWAQDEKKFTRSDLRAGFWAEICKFHPELADK
eukprot:RCo012815